jgi:hypothetical protein
VPGLERQDLITSINYYEEHNLDATALKQRLVELLKEEAAAREELNEAV